MERKETGVHQESPRSQGPVHSTPTEMLEWDLADRNLHAKQIDALQPILEAYQGYFTEMQRFFGDFLIPNTYKIFEKKGIPQIVQISENTGQLPLYPLETFAEFDFAELSDESFNQRKAEYREFLELLKKLQDIIPRVNDVIPYFTSQEVSLDKEGHIKITSLDFFKKDPHALEQIQKNIQAIIDIIEQVMLPLLKKR